MHRMSPVLALSGHVKVSVYVRFEGVKWTTALRFSVFDPTRSDRDDFNDRSCYAQQRFIDSEIVRWSKVAKLAGMTTDVPRAIGRWRPGHNPTA